MLTANGSDTKSTTQLLTLLTRNLAFAHHPLG